MSKILVTGGCGFIGSHLVDRLVKEDHDVYIIDNDCHGNSENWYNNDIKEWFMCDVNNINEVTDIKFDVIYHLGAESRIQPSLETPEETFESNVMGTVQVCKYARNKGSKVIYAGSCTAEDEYLNPYAFTKRKGEEVCKMYNEVYGVKTAIARFFNVYGERHYRTGDHATVLGIFERQYIDGEPFTITGDGEQRRDFIHVEDIVDGLIKISETECDNDIYDLGYGESYSIKEIACMFESVSKREIDIIYIEKPFGEMIDTLADVQYIENWLDWKPKHNVYDYIKDFINDRTK